MNQYESLVDRLRYCAEEVSGCGLCEFSDQGCGRQELLLAAAEVIDGYVNPKGSSAFDLEETVENCTVEIWKNSVTGDYSFGWYRGKKGDVTKLNEFLTN